MIEISNKSVYLASPKRLYTRPIYDRAYWYLERMKPIEILQARYAFKDNNDWLNNKSMLDVFDIMVVVSDNALVGKGVWTEFKQFKDNKKTVYHYCESGGFKTLIEIQKLQIINSNDWIDYAVIKY
jgi:hypothetical protein